LSSSSLHIQHAVTAKQTTVDSISDAIVAVRRAFGDPKPLAAEDVWQKPFDYDTAHLHRLAILSPTASAEPADLVAYALDFKYEQIQKDLFLHVLPFCLRAWHEDLTSPFGRYETFVDEFYPALLRGSVFGGVLEPNEASAVGDFMRAAILAEIDAQQTLSFKGSKGAAYAWFHALSTYGLLRDDIEKLWSAWWSADTVGRALAAAQYASCLIYDETGNPVFDAWTREHGGGPPCLWHYRGHVLEESWRPENLEFLERTLTPDGVRAVLDRSVARLTGHPLRDKVASIRFRLDARTETLANRCIDVRRFLATPNEAEYSFQWSA
jgi:hypothetical protein